MKKPVTRAPLVDALIFAAVPLLRVTSRGWSADVQHAFVAALSRCGVVTAAAQSVGRTARSAYMLRNRSDAAAFAKAWDAAIKLGQQDAHMAIMNCCFEPQEVPVIRRGVIIGTRGVVNEKLAMAAVRAKRTPPVKVIPPMEIWPPYVRPVVVEPEPLEPWPVPKRPRPVPRIRLL